MSELLCHLGEDEPVITKMRNYATRGRFREALIIGQNLFNRNSGNLEVFQEYASVLEAVMEAENTSEGKLRYFQLLSSALTTFSESATMDDGIVAFVIKQEDRLGKFYAAIQKLREGEIHKAVKEKVLANDKILDTLNAVVEEIKKAANKTDFDALLHKIQQCDAEVDKEYLTEKQKARYDSLTLQCSKLVDVKLRAFQRAADIEYNQRALEAYERVFSFFKTGKVTADHKEIIAGLFGFDPARLFNETLTYYNQVYAYVLSKLDDKGKFILTKAAILSELRR